VDAILTLADAQRAAGRASDAQESARRALAMLGAHPRSVGNAEQSARANRLLQI